MNFRNPRIVSGLGFPFGVTDIWWIEPSKCTLWEHALFDGNISLQKTFPAGYEQDTRKPLFLVLASPTLETSEKFHDSRVRYPDIS